ncbi:hypothetical protein P7C73_g3574, partial [Tremellales sp. Uapishka_1]
MGFFVQFWALVRKNWIILWSHRYINILRCFILPIAFAAFFAEAQNLFALGGNYGPGHISDLQSLSPTLFGHQFYWVPPAAAATNSTIDTFVSNLIDNVFAGTKGTVKRVATYREVEDACPETFALLSNCYGAVTFTGINIEASELNYTLTSDFGLAKLNTQSPSKDDVQNRILPLQWALDSNFIEMTTGTKPPMPLVWEYTIMTNAEKNRMNRFSYLRGIRSLIVLALFLVFLGVVYQLPGEMAYERANLLTSHLDAMGCGKAARIISWHLSISSAYVLAWTATALIWKYFIFEKTSAGLVFILYLVTGLSLASWTYVPSVIFSSTPTLAAVASTFAAVIFAIIALIVGHSTTVSCVLTLIFPPMFFVFFTRALCSWELNSVAPSLLRRSPLGDAPILALLVIAIANIVIWPLLALYLENKRFAVGKSGRDGRPKRVLRRAGSALDELPSTVAVRLLHIRKLYNPKFWNFIGRGKIVTAIEDLSFDIPKGEIFCLLGRNGAAKSTALGAIARTINTTAGSIQYADDQKIGLASQKDVLWDELTCLQHVSLWRRIKATKRHFQTETDEELLRRCDLAPKTHFLSKNLSGGQQRKLQLACALAGGSNLLLLDEISSGLDPHSRRAIWKLIIANRGTATIVLTTHYLDEADGLGDMVAILQQPGKLLALDSPVSLKHRLGQGITISVDQHAHSLPLLDVFRKDLPQIQLKHFRGKELYLTGSTDLGLIRNLLDRLYLERKADQQISYQINSASLQEVFLDINAEPAPEESSTPPKAPPSQVTSISDQDVESKRVSSAESGLMLTSGTRRREPWCTFEDAGIILVKRWLIFRKSFLMPVIAIVIVCCGAGIPLVFIKDRVQTCERVTTESRRQPLTYPYSAYPVAFSPVEIAPATAFGAYAYPAGYVQVDQDNATFVDRIGNLGLNITYGGISLAPEQTQQSLFAFEGTPLLNKGPSALNLLTNALLDEISPTITNPFRIRLSYRYLASPSFTSIGQAIKWLAFFGLGVSVYPAFACVYPTLERASNVRANQYSNGASPAALWLGHLLFELPSIFLVSIIITIVLATVVSQFNGIGILFICLVLYGISATLYAFIFSLFLNSPLASWALVAGSNVILFLLYLATYLLILTYDRTSESPHHITLCHFLIGLIHPVPNLLRATMVSLNLFNLLCDGLGNRTTAPYSSILQFGGPILYLVVQGFFAFGVLVYVDSGSPVPSFFRKKIFSSADEEQKMSADVVLEKERLERGDSNDTLKVLGLKKKYHGAKEYAVNDVWWGVKEGETFALLGVNGSGKTTSLACIRGVEVPTKGDVTVMEHSIVKHRNAARRSLGVCPQFNAIDANLTVRQHLWLYGRLKGVPSKALERDIESLLEAAGLLPKANALATSLSGGNQRKMSLAIALIGDRPVILIDEFSSGVDVFSLREAWQTLATLTKDRAVVMTTHSMEEVDALASRVGIIASKMLAVGTPASLKARYATYEIHLAAPHVVPTLEYLQAHDFPLAYRSQDTLTRISIPGVREDSLDRLLQSLQGVKSALHLEEMTVQEQSIETAFLTIVREHNIQEEESRHRGRARGSVWKRLFRRGAT